jgi:nucleotide-binding universal stress UspA family protein
MIQRLLVALDPDADTPVASRYAAEIAQRNEGAVTGLALVNETALKRDTAGGGIGSMHYAEKMRESLSEQLLGKARELLAAFGEQMDAAGVRHDHDHVDAGDPAAQIVENAKYHDLLVVGRTSHYYYASPETRTHTLAQIVEAGAAPTLVVDEAHRPIRKAMVAFDGGVQAARTLKAFAQMQPFGTLPVEIVHVRDDGADAKTRSQSILNRACRLLSAYGFDDVTETSLVDQDKKSRLLTYADGCGADLIVAGAFSKSGIKKWVFGSAVEGLLKEAKVPLFLYH